MAREDTLETLFHRLELLRLENRRLAAEIERLEAVADGAIKMLTEVLLLDSDPHPGKTLEYLSPSASLRKQADEIERREAIFQRAWSMIRAHGKVPERFGDAK
jgi:hypothetical protein